MIGPKKKEDDKKPARQKTFIEHAAGKMFTSYGYGKTLKEKEKAKNNGKPTNGRR